VNGPAARAAALVLALVPAAAGAEAPVPFLAGRVVDEAGLIPQPVRQRVEQRLRDLEQATGAQVAVLTVESLQGEPLEQYTHRVAETWKLGSKEKDDGALLFVARADRKMRLEVGYGLEDRLTDLRSRRILDEVVAPRFKAGDFGGGIEEGVKAMDAVVRGGEVVAQVPPAPVAPAAGEIDLAGRLIGGLIFVVVVGLFSVLAAIIPGPGGWMIYVFLMPFHCLFPVALFTPPVGLAWFAAWVIGYPIARRWLRKTGRVASWSAGTGLSSAGSWSAGHSWASSGDSSGGSSWSSSSSSDSSFSGGGGSFGGGGASSSW
jgi:uncharacterized protein